MRLLIAGLLGMSGVKTDLPVKCPKQKTDVGSFWTFHISNEKQNISLYNST